MYGPPITGPVRSTGASLAAVVLVIDAMFNLTCATCVFVGTAWLEDMTLMGGLGDIATILYALGAVYLLVAIIQLLVGFGVWTLKPWAWPAGIIVLILSIIIHIVGLMVGNVFVVLLLIFEIIALIFLILPETKACFQYAEMAEAQTQAPPPGHQPPIAAQPQHGQPPPPPQYGQPPPQYPPGGHYGPPPQPPGY